MVAVREKYANVTQVIYPSVVLFLINQSVSHPARYVVMAIQGDIVPAPKSQSFKQRSQSRLCNRPFEPLPLYFIIQNLFREHYSAGSTRIYAPADKNSTRVCERGMFDK
jgi:hypothetical protein